MNYQHQLSKVIEFIGKHIDEELTLMQLRKMVSGEISKLSLEQL